MPMLDKLGMVVKYSELEHASHLEESLEAWELAASAVLAREKALHELIGIKKDASKSSLVPVAESSIQILSREVFFCFFCFVGLLDAFVRRKTSAVN